VIKHMTNSVISKCVRFAATCEGDGSNAIKVKYIRYTAQKVQRLFFATIVTA
jgi:hypothetical protein